MHTFQTSCSGLQYCQTGCTRWIQEGPTFVYVAGIETSFKQDFTKVFKVIVPSPEISAAGTRYRLLGCTLHHGGGCHGGHYTAVVRRCGKWWRCSDSTVDEVSDSIFSESSFQQNAYCFLYRKCRASDGPVWKVTQAAEVEKAADEQYNTINDQRHSPVLPPHSDNAFSLGLFPAILL